MDSIRLQDILVKLETLTYRGFSYGSEDDGGFPMLESMIEELCPPSREIFLKEHSLLHLQPPITIAGHFYDFHYKLELILKDGGHPHRNSKYLFLENSIQNRQDDLRTILRLLAFKIKDPQSVYLLKGRLSGFVKKPLMVDELDEMDFIGINSTSIQMLEDCLASLPTAALISGKIICTPGGLHNLNQIMRIQRPINLSDSPLLHDLIGTYSRRQYSDDETEFLEKHDLHLVCCRNQVGSEKKDFAERRVVSLKQETGNAVLMRVEANLECSFRILLNKKMGWSYHISKQAATNKEQNPPVTKVGGSESVTSNPSPIRFDPANMYRSKSPGVKRFLGARV